MNRKFRLAASHVHAVVRKMKEQLRCWQCRMSEWIKDRLPRQLGHRE